MSSLAERATAFGVALTPAHESALTAFARELVDWNARVNLTSITSPDEIEVKHFLDSFSVCPHLSIGTGVRMIDVGTGAGFPGIPLQILYPQIQMSLLEATGKKVAFLQHVITTLGLANASAVHLRAEEAGQHRDHRESYDVALARAVARLPILLEYLLPLVKIGGMCIAMKGRTAKAEALDSTRAMDMLGGQLRAIEEVQLPTLDEPHYLIMVEKVADTPIGFPRKSGTPAQRPL
jgi:16S rRNA (guanine527-N7)-methyltransferase